MSNIFLVGEPMGLFIAQNEGALETVKLFSTAVAGAEYNVAVGLRRLEHSVSYMTKLGNDPFGRQIANSIVENGLNPELVSFSESNRTGLMLKSKVSSGDPEIYYYRKDSAASTISKEDIDRVDFSKYPFVHLTGVFPALSDSTLEAAYALAEKAKASGCTLFFDPNLRPSLWKSEAKMVSVLNELALFADYFLPGIKEASVLTGLSAPEEVAEYYLSRGVGHVIVKVGPKGAYAASKDGSACLPTYEIEKVVDTVGAGDGFAAGVISAVMEGLPLTDAVMRGNAIGSIQVMSVGDNEGLPTRGQLKTFMAEHKTMK